MSELYESYKKLVEDIKQFWLCEYKILIEQLIDENEGYSNHLEEARAENERLRAQLESAKAWIPQWAQEDDPAEDEAWKNL